MDLGLAVNQSSLVEREGSIPSAPTIFTMKKRKLVPRIGEAFTKLEAEMMATPAGRRRMAWVFTAPLMGGRNRPLPWKGYPDSPRGTLEVWQETLSCQ